MALLNNITYSPGEPMQDCFDKINAAIDAINAALGGSNNLKIKVVEMGDWDMDADAGKVIDIGVAKANIKSIDIIIRPDDPSTNCAPFLCANEVGSTEGWIRFDTFDSGPNEIYLGRREGGNFDSASFDSTSYNRGFITIIYTE